MSNTDTVTYSTNSDGAVTATSSNASVATASISGNNITIQGKSAGSATITVSVAETSNFTAVSKTISVNVTQEQTQQSGYITLSPSSVTFASTDPIGTKKTVNITSHSGEVSLSKNSQTKTGTNGVIKYTIINNSTIEIERIGDMGTDSNAAQFTHGPFPIWSMETQEYTATSVDFTTYVYKIQQTEQQRVEALLENFKFNPDELTMSIGEERHIELEGWAFDGNVTYDIIFKNNNDVFSSIFSISGGATQGYTVRAKALGTDTCYDIGKRVDTGQEIRRASLTVHVV